MTDHEKEVAADRQELEAQFYGQLEDELLHNVRLHGESEFLRRDLMRRSGIRDSRLIDELVRIGITPESLIAVRLIPLVMIAWSDREVSAEERQSIRVEAAKMGIGETTIPGKVLDAWLHALPPPELAAAWKRYVHLLMVSMSDEMSAVYIDELRQEMKRIARASGGKLGIGKISDEERDVIDRFTRLAHSAR